MTTFNLHCSWIEMFVFKDFLCICCVTVCALNVHTLLKIFWFCVSTILHNCKSPKMSGSPRMLLMMYLLRKRVQPEKKYQSSRKVKARGCSRFIRSNNHLILNNERHLWAKKILHFFLIDFTSLFLIVPHLVFHYFQVLALNFSFLRSWGQMNIYLTVIVHKRK